MVGQDGHIYGSGSKGMIFALGQKEQVIDRNEFSE